MTMYELINDLVALQGKKAAKAKVKPKSSYSLRKLILELAAEANSNVPVERHITARSVITVAERSLNKTAGLEKQTRIFAAYRDVASFVLFAVSGHTAGAVANTDLLPIGHPYATRKHRMSNFSLQEARARWIAADPRIDNSVREIVASAYSYPLGSEEQIHACSRLAVTPSNLVPRDIVLDAPTQALVAVAGFGLGGNSSAARSVRARLQRRDRNGQFAEQGGGLKFYLRKPNGSVVSVTGKFAGNALDSNDFIIEVKNDPVLKDGLYKVPTFKSEAVKAYLPGKKGDPEVAVSLPAGVDAVNLTELGPIDSPDGWDVASVKKEGDKGPDKVFKSGDGYVVEYYAPGNEDIKGAIQKAWKYNTPMGSGLSEPPSVKNADGQTGMQAKLSKEDPVFIMYRDDTDLTNKKSVAIAQDWSDIQDFAAADEKDFDAEYAKAKASKEKLDKANEESKAKLDEIQKKQADLDAQNADVRAEIEALALQGKDVNGNDIPQGWTALRNDSALYPTGGKTIDKNKAFGFVREEQGVSMSAFFDDEGKLDLNGQKFDSWDDLEAAVPDYVKGKIDETRNNAKEAIKPYDDGTVAEMIDNNATPEQVLEELKKNPKWATAMDDLETSWAVDLPSKSQKDSWAKLQKTINTINSMKPTYVEKTPETKAVLDETPESVEVPDAVKAEIPSAGVDVSNLIVPEGAYKLQLPAFEPEGRIDQDSKDYTDDPNVLANKFTTNELTDALAQALTGSKDFASEFLEQLGDEGDDEEEDTGKKKKTGPKPKKPPKPKGAASGYGALEFSQGEEFVPAEALYQALEEHGVDAKMTVAKIYDGMLGESKNVDMLTQAGKEENIKAVEPSILDSDDIEAIENMIDLNARLAQPDSSAVATAMINELSKNKDENPRINEMVEALDAIKGPDGYMKALDQFIGWAIDGDEDQKQAYRGLHALLISGDGGYAAPGEDSEFKTAVGNSIEKYTGSPATPEDIEKIFEEFGFWPDFLESKKKILTEEESINDKFSAAGSFYRLIAQMQKPNQLEIYRGMQLEENSDALKNITEKGAIISLDPRSFSFDKGIAGKFSGALTAKPAKGMNSVILTLRKGQGDSVDISSLSPFSDEQEHLVAGDFRIVEVKKKTTDRGHTLYNVTIEKISQRDAVLEGYRNDYEEFLLENLPTFMDLPEGYYTPASEPYTPMSPEDLDELFGEFDDSPLTIARMWEKDDLIEVYRDAIEDGSGKVILTYPIDDGYDATIDVEAVRDALQIQGIDTNQLMNDIANASPDVEPSDEEPEAAESNVNDEVLELAQEVGSEWDMEGWKQVGPQLGSNKGGFYEDKDGDRFYVKEAKSDLHAQNEALASALYRALGVDAAEIYMGSAADGKKKTFSPDIPDSKQDLQEKLKDKDYLAKLQEGFAVDAWLANWDVAGLVFDNVMSDGDGNPVRVDPGGALLFRAMGAPKGKLFGNEVNELDSLRDPNMNPQSASIFGSMTDEQQKESARKLLDISHDDIDTLVDTIIEDSDVANNLKDTLKARRQSILERYDLLSEDTSIVAETTDISDQDADVQEAKAADTVESRLETLLDWADEYGGDEGNYVEYEESKEKFKEIAKQVDAALVDYRNGDITDEQMPETLQRIEDLILSFEWDSNSGTSDELAWNNVDDLVSQIEKIRSTFYAPKPEDTPKPAVEPATDAVVNPYITGDGMPIEPGMKVKYNKTGETGTVIKYDKGNTNYVYVQMDGETKPKVKSTKQLSSASTPVESKTMPQTPEPSKEEPKDLVNPQLAQAKEDPELEPLELAKGIVENAYKYKEGRIVWNDVTNKWLVRNDKTQENLGTVDTVEEAKALIDGDTGGGTGPKAPEPSPAPESEKPSVTVTETKPSEIQAAEDDPEIAQATSDTGAIELNSYWYESETAEGKITYAGSDIGWNVRGKDKDGVYRALGQAKTVAEAKDLIEKYAAGEIPSVEAKSKEKEKPSEPKPLISLWDQEGSPEIIGDDKVGVRILIDSTEIPNLQGEGPSNLEEVGVNYVKGEGYTDDGMYYAEVELPLDKMDEFVKSWNSMLKDMAGPYATNPDYVTPQQFFGGIYDDYKTEVEANKQDKEAADAGLIVLDTTGTIDDLSGQIGAAIKDKKNITFNYNGKTRVVTPMSVWTNPKNGNINLYGVDTGDDGKKKNFTLQYIESAPNQTPTPSAEKIAPQEAPQNLPVDETSSYPTKTQLHAKWIQDILASKGKRISYEKAEEIRDAIDENGALEKWSSATNEEVYSAILDVVGPGIVDLEEDATSDEPQTPKVPVAPEGEMKISDVNGNDVFKGVEITDKKGNKGTVLKVNKDNYALVEFADGTKGWRSANTISTTGEINSIASLKTFAPKKGKVTPAGTEAIIVENPGAWDTSEFEGAPSLLDAMEIVQTPDSKKAPMRGASAAVDSDSIEDLDVRVMRVRDAEGKDSLQLKFKLTSWAGNAKAKQLLALKDAGELFSNGVVISPQLIVDRLEIGEDGIGQINKTKSAWTADGGLTWTITTDEGLVVKIHRANKDATSKAYGGGGRAFHNMVTITAPVGATPEQVAKALSLAGVQDVRPATQKDARVLIENRLMSVLDAKTDATKNLSGEERAKSLERIKDKYGITPDDVTVTTGASGRLETRLTPEAAQKIVDATGKPEALQHNLTIPYDVAKGGNDAYVEWLANLFSNPQEGLLSTTTRWTEGIGTQGMSSGHDVATGGADYVFTRPMQAATAKKFGTGGIVLYFDPNKAYQRLDFYANYHDGFGKRQSSQDVISAAKVGAYEVMFKQRLGWDDLDVVVVKSETVATELKAMLRVRGVESLGGKPLDEAIIYIQKETKD